LIFKSLLHQRVLEHLVLDTTLAKLAAEVGDLLDGHAREVHENCGRHLVEAFANSADRQLFFGA